MRSKKHGVLHFEKNRSNQWLHEQAFQSWIRTWYGIEDATGLRTKIVDLLLDLIRNLEMLEINNQTVIGLAHKEKAKMK